MSRQRKSGTKKIMQTGNHTFWDESVLGDRQRKEEKGSNLWHLNVTFCSLCSYHSKISHAGKFPSYSCAMNCQSRLHKDKNPSSPLEGGAGMKIREYDP